MPKILSRCKKAQARLVIEYPQRKGCLIVNTIAEREAHSEATQALAQARLAEVEAFLMTSATVAVAASELSPETDPERLSDALVGEVVAIRSIGRTDMGANVISHIAEEAIEDLGCRARPLGSHF